MSRSLTVSLNRLDSDSSHKWHSFKITSNILQCPQSLSRLGLNDVSCIHTQADTDEHLQARPEVQKHLFHAAHAPVPSIPMQRGTAIPLARDGLPILGAPIGTSAYCTAQIRKTIASIQRDLDLLSTFDHRHQRTKLALYCCNSSIVYLLRELPLEVVRPDQQKNNPIYHPKA